MEEHPATLSTYRTMKLIVYDELRNSIIRGDLVPGSRLISEHLSKQMGVSLTPVREALHRLEAEGLVKVNPHHCVEVSQLSIGEIIEIYHIRGALESLAARLAVPNLTVSDFEQMTILLGEMDGAVQNLDFVCVLEVNRKFHSLIWKASRSVRLYELLENYYDSSQRFRNVSIKVPGRLDQISFEHRRIAQALQAGDKDLASQYTLEHYEKTADYLLNALVLENKDALILE